MRRLNFCRPFGPFNALGPYPAAYAAGKDLPALSGLGKFKGRLFHLQGIGQECVHVGGFADQFAGRLAGAVTGFGFDAN